MEQHYTLTDNEFEKQFQTSSLDPAIFTHEAHLRLAWIKQIGVFVVNCKVLLTTLVQEISTMKQ